MQDFDVVIIGCGPVGAVAANLLGAMGHRVAIFDKEVEFHNETRAIHMDHEAMRILQAIRVDRLIIPKVRRFAGMEFLDADHRRLFLLNAADEVSGEQGYMFSQPFLEEALRLRIDESPVAELHLGTEVEALEDDGEWVRLQVRDSTSGDTREVRAKYVIAADGSTSGVRKQLGIQLDNISFDEPWVVVDCELLSPLDTPDYGQQVCDIRRPSTFIPGEGLHRRWEFMLLPGETAEDINTEDQLYRLMAPWGITRDNLRINRSAVYLFHALVATSWREGRVFLAGDACHQTPPFLGQGMCAGFRDVANLGWKLDLVLRGLASDDLLDTYEQERAPHARRLVEEAVQQGHIICTIDPEMVETRDQVIAELAAIEDLSFYDVVPPLAAGVFQAHGVPDLPGQLAPQPRVRLPDGEVTAMDNATGSGFRIVSREPDPLAAIDADTRAAWDSLGGRCLTIAADAGYGATAVHDVDGRLGAFFDAHGCNTIVIRPDHYVFGSAGGADEVSGLIRELSDQLTHSRVAAEAG